MIPGSAGGNAAQATPFRQLRHALVAGGVAMGQMLLQLQKYRAGAEPAGVSLCPLFGHAPAAGGNVLRQQAIGIPQQYDETLGVGLQEADVQNRRGASARHVRQRNQSTQIGVTRAILRDKGHRTRPVTLAYGQVGAQYRLDAGGAARLHEIQRAAQIVRVGHPQGRIPVTAGPFHQLCRRRSPGAEGIPGVGAQLDEAGGQVSNPADTTRRWRGRGTP